MYVDEEGMSVCKGCPSFADVMVKSNGERDSQSDCYVPAEEYIADESGSFMHVMDCFL